MNGYGFKCKNGHISIEDTSVNLFPCPTCKAPMSRDVNVPGGRLDPYAWPGGYPLIYIGTRDGDLMCAECAEIYRDDPDNDPIDYMIHWEGDSEFCCDCGKEIEPAYNERDI